MSTKVLPAKISRPRLSSKVLLRQRLIMSLSEGLKKKGVWVAGPPGAGKTTLVNSFIEAKKLKVLWYQVDASDADPAAFFHNIGTWVEAACRKKNQMPRFLPELASNIEIFSSRYFQELFSRIKPPFLIVLDNFQEASAEVRFTDAVCAGAKQAPEGCSFIFISREEPPQAFARACVNKEMAVLKWEDIRLTEAESLATARLLGFKQSAVKDLHSKAEGWMAGLLLLLEQMRSGVKSEREISRGATNSSFNYFMAEVFDKIDPAAQNFLLKSSLFRDMTPEMASEISGEKDAARILSSLNAGNFFVSKRTSPQALYQHHALFRDFLIARAKDLFDPDELDALRTKASAICERVGQIDEAAGLLIEARDWPELGRFLQTHAISFISQGRLRAVGGMLDAMPEDLVKKSPWLLYYHGVCLLPSSPTSARPRFEAAYELFGKDGSPEGAFLSWAGVVETVMYEWKDFKPLDRWIVEFEGLMKKYGEFPSREIEVRAISCIFSALMFRQPEHPDLPKWEEQINRLALESKDFAMKISITRNLILYYLWTGNVIKAGVLVEMIRHDTDKDLNDPLAHLMWLRSAALYSMFIASTSECRTFVDKGLKLAEKTGIHLMDTLFCGVGIYACMLTGNVALAETFLEMIRKEIDSERCMDLVFYHHQTAMVELLKGNFSKAIESSEVSLRLAIASGMKINLGIYYFTQINLLIQAGRHEGIREYISVLKKMARLTKSHFYDYVGNFSDALFDFKQGNYDKSKESLRKVMKTCREHGIKVMSVLIHPSQAAAMCAMALDEGIETEFVRELIELNNLKGYPPRPGVEAWPWELKIYTLGRFEIYRGGKKIEFSRKAQQKPLALLKELISVGGRPMPEEALADALWPDSEGDLAYRSFATTLHRLRKLLGNDKSVRYVDGMASLDESCFWVDAWAFNYLVQKAESAADKKESERLFDKAYRIYKGEYLPGGEGLSSAISNREKLRMKFIKCLESLGLAHEKAGLFDKALELYKAGIENDQLAEGFYRRMMNCYKAVGKNTEALKTYSRLKTVLSDNFGIDPSAQTEAIYRSLLKK